MFGLKTHVVVEASYKCNKCGYHGLITLDLDSYGKHLRKGNYASSTKTISQTKVDLPWERFEMVFYSMYDRMPKINPIALYFWNCESWALDLFNKLKRFNEKRNLTVKAK